MVIRRLCMNSLRTLEPLVTEKASRLGEAVEQPGNVRSAAELLNAAIEPMGMPARGRGYLTRDGNNWIVRVEGDISNGLNND